MIYGIGVDTATVARLEKSMSGTSGPHFLARVFGEAERALIAQRGRRGGETAAACFAAKEALGKALGTGLAFELCEVQALRGERGAPYLAFSGAMAQQMREKALTAYLSLTHEGGFATAFVVLEQCAVPERCSGKFEHESGLATRSSKEKTDGRTQ